MRRKRLKKWFARFLVSVLMVSALFQPGAGRIVLALEKGLSDVPGDPVPSGTSNGISWAVSEDGELTVSGTGDYVRESRDGQGAVAPWWDFRESIVSAKVEVTGMADASRMFYGCSSLTSVDVSHFFTDNVENMAGMFSGCSSLTSVDVSNFFTGNVENMAGMFSGCSSLASVDVSDFFTDEVTDMASMFSGCNSLTSVDVSDFFTDEVTDMASMFSGCSSLTSVDVSDFFTHKVTNMASMFSGCSSLTSVDVSHFFTDNVENMAGMFSGCSMLTDLDLSNFDMSRATNVSNMLAGCDNLSTINAPRDLRQTVALPSGTWYRSDFSDGTVVSELPLGLISSVTITRNAGSQGSLPAGGVSRDIEWNIDIDGNLTVSGTGDYERIYYDYTPWMSWKNSIVSAQVRVTGMTNAYGMFRGYANLESVDLSGLDTSAMNDMSYMFAECSRLKNVKLSNINSASKANAGRTGIDMSGMFAGCSMLTNLDLSNFDMSRATNVSNMLAGCDNLRTIKAPLNLSQSVALPSSGAWYLSDGTVVSELPKGLTQCH